MSQAQRRFLDDGTKYYVPAMQAAGDLGEALNGRIALGAPIVAAGAAILAAISVATAVDSTTFLTTNTEAQMGRWGRTLTTVASGAATSNVTVYGRDYLGQRIAESFTLNGATPVVGKKAFRWVDRVTAGITAATTINLGLGTGFGLPYVTMAIMREYADNVVATAGTLTAPIFTDPQTLTTGDPRGTVVPTTTPNGAKQIEMECEFSQYVNAAGNGGMHGIKHVNA